MSAWPQLRNVPDMSSNPFRYFKTSPEIIRLAVMLYVRFPLSLRNVEDLAQRTIDLCHAALKDANRKPAEIDEVVLVGSMACMPKIVRMVSIIFGKEPLKSVNPDEAVVMGAALSGAKLQRHGAHIDVDYVAYHFNLPDHELNPRLAVR